MNIAMVSIHVTDPAAAHDVYVRRLGFETVLAMPEMRLFIVTAPGEGQPTQLLLEPSDNPIAADYMTGLFDAGFPAMVFGTADLDAEIERLRDAGIAFRGDVVCDSSGRSIVFEDSVGNLLQLHEAPHE